MFFENYSSFKNYMFVTAFKSQYSIKLIKHFRFYLNLNEFCKIYWDSWASHSLTRVIKQSYRNKLMWQSLILYILRKQIHVLMSIKGDYLNFLKLTTKGLIVSGPALRESIIALWPLLFQCIAWFFVSNIQKNTTVGIRT